MILQLRRMETDGFLPIPLAQLVFLADNGADALAHLEAVVSERR